MRAGKTGQNLYTGTVVKHTSIKECWVACFFLQDLDQKYRVELDSLRKKLVKELEKTEQQQFQQYKTVVKQLKNDQVRLF